MYVQSKYDLIHLAALPPASRAVGQHNTSIVDLANYHSVSAIVQAGDIGAGASLTAVWQVSVDAAFTSPVTVTASQVEWNDTQDNQVAFLSLLGEHVAQEAAGARYARLRLTVAGAAIICAAEVVALDERYAPAPDAAGFRGRT
jgi:hypothetical protein